MVTLLKQMIFSLFFYNHTTKRNKNDQIFTDRCKYSATKTLRILFKSSTVFASIRSLLSSGVCQPLGNGDGIICKIGTPEKMFQIQNEKWQV